MFEIIEAARSAEQLEAYLVKLRAKLLRSITLRDVQLTGDAIRKCKRYLADMKEGE